MTTAKDAPAAPTADQDAPPAPAKGSPRNVGDKVALTVDGARVIGTVIAPGKDADHYLVQAHGQEVELIASRLKDPSDLSE